MMSGIMHHEKIGNRKALGNGNIFEAYASFIICPYCTHKLPSLEKQQYLHAKHTGS